MLKEQILVKDRYLLLKIIGKGEFSEVWLADDTRTSTRVALKFYAPDTGLDDEEIHMLTCEVALLFDLNHSNLLKPIHYDHYERMPFLVLTYCENGSARKLINRMDEEKAWRFIRDVSAGLYYLHSCDPPIIHRNINPDNILIDGNGRFVIMDFIINRHRLRIMRRGENTSLYRYGGEAAYLSPEQFRTDPKPVKADDIYSLGATLFELLTGTPPFGKDDGLLPKRGADIPGIKGNYSPILKKIIRQCMEENTWERPIAIELINYAEHMLGKGWENPRI
jgi:serine/threonine protein kinase